VTNYHLWSFISPEDVAQAFELALNLQDGRYDCFFITADTGLNSRPTLEMFRERFGFDPVLRKPELFKEVPNAGIFDNSRAKRILGFKPMVTKSDFNR
jgi:nucleoside-diphosphate-sugar epimerase